MSFSPALFHIEEILFFVFFGVALLVRRLEEKTFRIPTPIDLPIFLFLGWVLLTIPFSLNPEYSFSEWRKLLAQVLVFYWAILVIRQNSQENDYEYFRLPALMKLEGIAGKIPLQNVLLGVLLGISLLSLWAIIDFWNRGGNWQDRDIRALALGSDYNWLSTYLVLSIPIVFFCGMTARFLWGKVFAFCTFSLSVLSHIAAYSRAGWLASVAQLFTWGIVWRRRFLLIFLIFGLVVLVFAAIGISQMGFHADTLHSWTLETRMQVWKLGLEKIISHPIVGIGYGNNTFQPILADSPMGKTPMHLHNTPLMIGVGTGIPGFVLFLWLFVRLAVEYFPKNYQTSFTFSESLKLCFGIVLVGFFCRNLFDYMFAGSLAYLFWILMACGLEVQEKILPNSRMEEIEEG